MDKEIQEMGKFACVVCEMCGTDEKGGFRCIAGINQDTCNLCRALGKALYDAGYHKTEVKTNGDKIRSMSDKELANYLITSDYYYDEGVNGIKYITPKGSFLCRVEAYQENLEWLNKEYKGE